LATCVFVQQNDYANGNDWQNHVEGAGGGYLSESVSCNQQAEMEAFFEKEN